MVIVFIVIYKTQIFIELYMRRSTYVNKYRPRDQSAIAMRMQQVEFEYKMINLIAYLENIDHEFKKKENIYKHYMFLEHTIINENDSLFETLKNFFYKYPTVKYKILVKPNKLTDDVIKRCQQVFQKNIVLK